MKVLTLSLAIAVSFFSWHSITHAQWVQTNGPYGSLVQSFAVSGTNLFAGTFAGGVFLSTDNGTSWTAVNSGLTNTSVPALAVSGTNLFAGTLGGGVFLSTDNGTSWTAVNVGLTSNDVRDLAVSGTNLFAATLGGVFLSTNDGGSWIEMNNGLTDQDMRALAAKGTSIFAGAFSDVFRSTDNGLNWVGTGLVGHNIQSLIVSGSDIFAGTFGDGVFRSTDDGTTWTQANNGLANPIVASFGVNGPNLFAGTQGGGVFLSTDNGTSWTAVNSGLTSTLVYALAVSGTNLFAGTLGGGVFLSTDNGTSWTAVNSGLTNTDIRVLAVSGTNLFAGTYGGGVFLSTDNGATWTAVNSGLVDVDVNALVILGANLFAGTNRNFASTDNGDPGGRVFLSTDIGTSWAAVSGLPDTEVNALAVSGTNLFAGTFSGAFLSTNNGTSWTAVNSGLTNIVSTLAVSGTNLFAGTLGGGVFLSTNNGTSWATVNSGLANGNILALAVSGTNLFAGTLGGGVFLSTNNGTSWAAVNSGLANGNILALAISGTNLFAGVFLGGIFLSTDNGTSWTGVNSGLTSNDVRAFTVSGTDLFAGTYGQGVWRRPLSEFGPGQTLIWSGATGNWFDPQNWIPPVVPGAADTAVINSGTPLLNNPVTIAVLRLSGGDLQNSSQLDITAELTWSGGSLSGQGTTSLLAGGTMDISGSSDKTLDGHTLHNAGIGTWTGAGNILMGITIPAFFVNESTGNFTILNDASFIRTSPPGSVINRGVLVKEAGTGTTTFSGVDFIIEGLSGEVFVESGNMLLSGEFNNAGIFNIAASSTVTLTGSGTIGGTVSVFGVLNFSGGLFAVDSTGVVQSSGTVLFQSGVVTVLGIYEPGVTQVNGGTVVFDGIASNVEDGSLTQGTIAGGGALTILNSFTWSGGTMGGGGSTLIDPNATVTIGGGGQQERLNGRTIVNLGTITWTNDAGILSVGGTNVITNENGGIFNSQNNSSMDASNGTLSFENRPGATFSKSGNSTTTAFTVPFTNAGTVNIQSGTIQFSTFNYVQTAGVTNLIGGGTLSTNQSIDIQGGVLDGSGDILGNVINSGVVSPGSSPGFLNITGNYTQLSGAVLNMEIGGFLPGQQFDGMQISGNANLDGTLNVSLINGFQPVDSNSFQLLTFGSRSGSFATINGLDIGGGLALTPNYGTGDLTLNTEAIDAITVTQSQFEPIFTAGSTLRHFKDTTSQTVDVGRTGGPNVYDFRNLPFFFDERETTFSVSQIPQLAPRYPSGAVALRRNKPDRIEYPIINFGSNIVTNPGQARIVLQTSEESYQHCSPEDTFLKFPITFGAQDSQTVTAVETTYVNGIPIMSGSNTNLHQSFVDGYGTLLLPGGRNFECLRTRFVETPPLTFQGFRYVTREGALLFVDSRNTQPDTGSVQTEGISYFLGGSLSGSAAVITWTGAVSNDWFDPNNWNPSLVPTPADTVVIDSGTPTLDGAATIGGMILNGGTLNGTGMLTVTGTLNWMNNGVMGGGGTTVIGQGAIMTIGGGVALSGRTIANLGTTRWDGALIISIGGTNLFTNAAGSVFNARTNGGMGINSGSLTFSNDSGATLNKTGNSTTTQIDVPFSNAGTFNIQSGTIQFTGSNYVQTAGITHLVGGGTLSTNQSIDIQGGVLNGSGDILGNVINSGVVSPGSSPGFLNITGNYAQLSGAVLNMEIGGFLPGQQFDGMQISGNATLDGALNISLINGFQPVESDSFQLLTFGSRSGSFAAVNGLDIGGGLVFTPNYTGTNFTLNTVATTISTPTLVAPSDGAANQSTTLALFWNPVPAATSYRVQLATDSNFVTGIFVDDSTVTDSTRSISGLAINTAYYWHVRAQIAQATGAYSQRSRFTTAVNLTWVGQVSNDWFSPNNWNPPAVPTPSDTVIINSGTPTLNGFSTIGGMSLNGGTLNGTGTLTVQGTLTWAGGQMGGGGMTVITPGGALNISANNVGLAGRFILTRGTTTWSGFAAIQSFSGTNTISNEAGASFLAQNNSAMQVIGGGSITFTNKLGGVITRSGSGGNTNIAVPFTNAGTVNILGGNFLCTGSAYAQSGGVTHLEGGILTSTTLIDIQGGVLNGEGQITGSVLNASQISPGQSGAAGLITISGSYTQSATGVLNMEIGGLQTGQFDALNISGDAMLNGALNVGLVNGYFPTAGDQFPLLTNDGVQTGVFAAINGLDVGGGLEFVPEYVGPFFPVFRLNTRSVSLAPPVLLIPLNGAINQPTTLSLVWSSVPAATSYRVRLSTDSNFVTGIVLDDSTVVGTMKTVVGLFGNITYYWQVRAQSGAASPYSPRRSFNTVALTAISPILSSAVSGNAVSVAVPLPAGLFSANGDLFYRRAGHAAYDVLSLSRRADTLVGDIPANLVTEQGVEYYVQVTDGPGIVTFPVVSPATNPAIVRVGVQNIVSPATLHAITYKMVSVPLELSDPGIGGVLGDDFGPYDSRVWRLFRWKDSAYVEHPNIVEQFTPGNAFWVINRDEATYDVENGRSTNSVGAQSIMLENGWNQIANPFAFPVAWSSIQNTNSVRGPIYYDGIQYQPGVNILEPWEGYWVFDSSGAVVLSVPPVEAGPNLAGISASREINMDTEYQLQLSASIPGTKYKDTYNDVGFMEHATEGMDMSDYPEPPLIGDYVQLSVIQGSRRFMSDFKPIPTNGAQWELQMRSTLANQNVRIVLAETGQFPSGFHVYILDHDNYNIIPVVEGVFTVQGGPASSVRSFRVIIGTEQYAQTHNDGIPLVPLEYALEQNYPNPFNPTTTIRYQLGKRSVVVLEIFNVLGQRVNTLVNEEQVTGVYSVLWDGRNDAGRSAASGIYLYRLRAGDFVAARKLVLLH